MLFQCWASVQDGGPTLKQHRLNASYVLGINSRCGVTSNALIGA